MEYFLLIFFLIIINIILFVGVKCLWMQKCESSPEKLKKDAEAYEDWLKKEYGEKFYNENIKTKQDD